MKKLLCFSLLLIFSLSLFSCEKNDNNDKKEEIINDYIDGYLEDVDDKYFLECENKGTIISSTYPSYDYLKDPNKENKKDREYLIYLPYGYDENNKYDIFYFMHGWLSTPSSFLKSSNIKNMLDNMIDQKLIKPLIFVSLTYDIDTETSNLFKGIDEVKIFHKDFYENAMPYIENKYSTYLENVTDNDMKLSRSHRGFGGFSLGATATWFELVNNYDYISLFLPMSGILLESGNVIFPNAIYNANYFKEVEKNFNNLDYKLYAASGTYDILYPQMDEFIKRIKNDKMSYYLKEGNEHYNIQTLPYFFNGLINLFGEEL